MLCALLCGAAHAESAEPNYPICAWTTREVETYSRPEEGAQDGGWIAPTGRVTWLGTQGKWARVDAQGMECYVPVDALTTDRVFDFSGYPTRSADWLYEGEICISPDGAVLVTIGLAEEYRDASLFGGGELLRFEVIAEDTGNLVCTAELDPNSDPMVFRGEGVYEEGTSLLVRPMIGHSGYSVEIQW